MQIGAGKDADAKGVAGPQSMRMRALGQGALLPARAGRPGCCAARHAGVDACDRLFSGRRPVGHENLKELDPAPPG